jgi:hypothetical protein
MSNGMTATAQKELVLDRVLVLRLLVLKLHIGNEPLRPVTIFTKTV